MKKNLELPDSKNKGKLMVAARETGSSLRGNYRYRWLMICCRSSRYWPA